MLLELLLTMRPDAYVSRPFPEVVREGLGSGQLYNMSVLLCLPIVYMRCGRIVGLLKPKQVEFILLQLRSKNFTGRGGGWTELYDLG
jgi:hypothetical protein